MKSNCAFVIKASEHPKKRQEAKHQKAVRITGFELDHVDDCNPSMEEYKIAAKAAGRVVGQLDLSKMGILW
jgi:hypothetical protein